MERETRLAGQLKLMRTWHARQYRHAPAPRRSNLMIHIVQALSRFFSKVFPRRGCQGHGTGTPTIWGALVFHCVAKLRPNLVSKAASILLRTFCDFHLQCCPFFPIPMSSMSTNPRYADISESSCQTSSLESGFRERPRFRLRNLGFRE